MTLLTWRDARHGDRRKLGQFVCTDGALKREYRLSGSALVHPRIWEFEVQEHLQRLRVPLKGSRTARVGVDAQGIGAVSVSKELDAGLLYELEWAGIACRLRGQGGGYADEMMRDTLDLITSRCAELGSSDAVAMGYIHPQNHASQAMCRRLGMTHKSVDPDSGYQYWSMSVPTPPVDER